VWETSIFVSPGEAAAVPCVTPSMVGGTVGVPDGISVGFTEGALVGRVEGDLVGCADGPTVGIAVVGAFVGIAVGEEQPAQVTSQTLDTS
jgi:hypothetical protein